MCSARVVLVERDPSQSFRLGDKLAGRGYTSIRAASTDEALLLAATDGVGVVLINGADTGNENDPLALRLKSRPATAHIPVIMIGGPTAGADLVLSRPVEDADLFARLDVITRLNTMHEELGRRAETSSKYGVEFSEIAQPHSRIDSIRILIAGGNATDAQDVEAILGPATTIVVTEGGQATLERLAVEKFDLILIAEANDNQTVLNTCGDIRGNPSLYHIPVVVAPAAGSFDDAAPLFARGANDLVRRPWIASDFHHRVTGLVRQYRFRLDMQRVYRDARHLVTSDALTGLYNHGFLMEHLTSQIDDAKRFARNLTLGMLGIVNMAGLNRHYGYAAGDRLLRQLGGLASRLVRGEDLIARYSGTQFCVVLPDTPADLAFFALHRIASVVEHTEFALPDHNTPVRLTIKIGAASIQPIDSAESLIDRARAAMV